MRRARTLSVLIMVVSCAVAASAAAAESFGKMPTPDQSRCAGVTSNRKLLNIGQVIVLHASPITDSCGAPTGHTHYQWDTTDPSLATSIQSLVQVHPCAEDARSCVYRARLFTQPGMWQGVGISGSSPDGGWGSDQPFAVRYGHYFGVAVGVNNPAGHPKVVHVTGGGKSDSTTASVGGDFNFALLPGAHTFSYSIGSRSFRLTVHLKEPPGKSIGMNLGVKTYNVY